MWKVLLCLALSPLLVKLKLSTILYAKVTATIRLAAYITTPADAGGFHLVAVKKSRRACLEQTRRCWLCGPSPRRALSISPLSLGRIGKARRGHRRPSQLALPSCSGVRTLGLFSVTTWEAHAPAGVMMDATNIMFPVVLAYFVGLIFC